MSDALLLKLEALLEEIGWKQPARMYLIEGSNQEPELVPLANFDGHPCDALRDLWASGHRAGDAIALALVVEGVRHLRYEEVEERAPQMFASLHTDVDLKEGEELETVVRNGWEQLASDTSAAQMPPSLQVQIRNSVAVTLDGWTIMVVRDQGGEPEVLDPVPPKRLELSRVPHFMWLFLTDQEPTD